MDVLRQKNIMPADGYTIVIWNNTLYTSPIEVLPEDEFQDDYAVMLLPEGYPLPRSKMAVERAICKGYPLHILTPPNP